MNSKPNLKFEDSLKPLSKTLKQEEKQGKICGMERSPKEKNCEHINPGQRPHGTVVPPGTASPCQIAGRLVVRGVLAHDRAPCALFLMPGLPRTSALLLNPPKMLSLLVKLEGFP